MNCTGHLNSSFIAGTSVNVVVPINGFVDVQWLYVPRPGTIQGTQLLTDGTSFRNATVTIDGVQTGGAGNTFTSSVSSGSHVVSSVTPSGYSVSYSTCSNCLQHSTSSFQQGTSATVSVLPGSFVDVQFLYQAVPAFTITSPGANQTFSGNVTLSLSGSSLLKAASVEYLIGSNRIARVAAQPLNPFFQYSWNSALASDGNSQIDITARDYLDNILFQEARPIVINNYGNAAAASLAGQLSGPVPFTLTGYDSIHFPAYWQVFIDGEIAPGSSGLLFSDHDGVHQNARTAVLNTTLYPNGRHELHYAFHSNDYPQESASAADLDFRGMATQNVNIDNGRAFMDVVSNYLFVYTTVSAGVQLTCVRVYTNGDRDPCATPSFAMDPLNSSPGIQVSANGIVTGSQEGYGDVVVGDSGKSTAVHVWVRNDPGLPHFQDGGTMATTYQAGKSLFAIAPFQLGPDQLQADSTLLAETRRAGINTLNRGIYLPNGDLNRSFDNWKQSFDSIFPASWAWSLANGFHVLGAGDDMVRRPGWEATWIANWPASQPAIQYAMQKFSQSGAALALDVVDESSALWGSNPTPVGRIGLPHSLQSVTCAASCTAYWPSLNDPAEFTYHDPLLLNNTFVLAGDPGLATPVSSSYRIKSLGGAQFTFDLPTTTAETRTFDAITSPNLEYLWFSGSVSCQGGILCNPPLPNSVLSAVAGWLRAAPSAVAISWPPSGVSLPFVHKNWMGNGSISDYASHYWDSNQQRRTYKFGVGVRENQNSMLTAFLGRQTSVNFDHPQIIQQSMMGISYLKYAAAGVSGFSPPADKLLHVGNTPQSVVSGIFTAAAAGTAGVKLYRFDTDASDRTRNAGNGSGFEAGASPASGETRNWQAMGYASSVLTKAVQDYILGQPVSSPALGRNIITGARQGVNGNLLLVVNGWDGTRTLPIDFSPFRTGNPVLRYRVTDTGIKIQSLPDGRGETVVLSAGESAIYLFPRIAAIPGVEAVVFQPDTTGLPSIVRTSYLYSQNTQAYGDPVDCSSGCTVNIDRKLGDAFYSYSVLGADGTLQCQSAPLLLPLSGKVTLATGLQTRGAVCR